MTKAGEGGTRNQGSLQLPTSPYQVMAGTVISAALVTGINSEVPGQVIASVNQAVYNTATGRRLLLPQGARLNRALRQPGHFRSATRAAGVVTAGLPDTPSVALDRLPGIAWAGFDGFLGRGCAFERLHVHTFHVQTEDRQQIVSMGLLSSNSKRRSHHQRVFDERRAGPPNPCHRSAFDTGMARRGAGN